MWWPALLIIPYLLIFLYFWYFLRQNDIFKLYEGIADESGSHHYIPVTRVSIVIAVRNEMGNLPSLITDLNKLSYPGGLLEIIFVDDNSEDSTYDFLVSATADSKTIKVIRNIERGKKHALI